MPETPIVLAMCSEGPSSVSIRAKRRCIFLDCDAELGCVSAETYSVLGHFQPKNRKRRSNDFEGVYV